MHGHKTLVILVCRVNAYRVFGGGVVDVVHDSGASQMIRGIGAGGSAN